MKVEYKVGVIFFLALLTVGLVGSLSYLNARDLLENEKSVVHTYRVLDKLNGLLVRSQDVERAARAFYATGRESDLEPYRAALDAVNPALKELREQTADDFAQRTRADRLQTLVNRNISIAQRRVDARRKSAVGAAVLILAAEDQQTGDELRGLIAVMREAENHLLDERTRTARLTSRRTRLVLALPLGGSIALLGAFCLFIRRDLGERRRTEEALRASDEKFRGVLENAPDAILVSAGDGEIQLVNSQAERVFGFPRAELIGRYIGSLLVERPAPAPEAGDLPSATPTAKPASEVRAAPPKLHGVRKGGELFPLELTQNLLEVGGEHLLISAIRDQTER